MTTAAALSNPPLRCRRFSTTFSSASPNSLPSTPTPFDKSASMNILPQPASAGIRIGRSLESSLECRSSPQPPCASEKPMARGGHASLTPSSLGRSTSWMERLGRNGNIAFRHSVICDIRLSSALFRRIRTPDTIAPYQKDARQQQRNAHPREPVSKS